MLIINKLPVFTNNIFRSFIVMIIFFLILFIIDIILLLLEINNIVDHLDDMQIPYKLNNEIQRGQMGGLN